MIDLIVHILYTKFCPQSFPGSREDDFKGVFLLLYTTITTIFDLLNKNTIDHKASEEVWF